MLEMQDTSYVDKGRESSSTFLWTSRCEANWKFCSSNYIIIFEIKIIKKTGQAGHLPLISI